MIETAKPVEREVVNCETCLKEIPRSEAQSAEGRDHILYFCGLECYDIWEEEEMRERTREAGEP